MSTSIISLFPGKVHQAGAVYTNQLFCITQNFRKTGLNMSWILESFLWCVME